MLSHDNAPQFDLLYVDSRGLFVMSYRARNSRAVREAVEFLGLDDEINAQATAAYPEEFVICGPLTVAAYRATWLPELDANGQRVRRAPEQPNEQPTLSTTGGNDAP